MKAFKQLANVTAECQKNITRAFNFPFVDNVLTQVEYTVYVYIFVNVLQTIRQRSILYIVAVARTLHYAECKMELKRLKFI